MGFPLHQIQNSQGIVHLVQGLGIVYGLKLSRFGQIAGKMTNYFFQNIEIEHGVLGTSIATISTHAYVK